MISWFQIGLAGLWPLVWKFGITGILIGGCVAIYFFTPVFLARLFPNIQKVAIWVALGLSISLVSYAVGVADEHNRVVAKQVLETTKAYENELKARADAEAQVKARRAAPERKPSRWLPNDRRDGYSR